MSSTAYALAAAITSAKLNPEAGPSLVASNTAVTGPRPRFKPKLSGLESSKRTLALKPPSLSATDRVPESWNTSRKTAGAFVFATF